MSRLRARVAPLHADLQRRVARYRGVTIGPGCEIHASVRIDGPVQLGEHCRLRQDVYIRGPRVQLGNWVFLNDGVYVNHDVYLADHVSVGQFTRFVTGTHAIGPHEHRAGATRTEPIHVGLGTWIGASVTVLPGVTIGAGVIVASGALVLDDVEDDCLVAGVPAVVKRRLGP